MAAASGYVITSSLLWRFRMGFRATSDHRASVPMSGCRCLANPTILARTSAPEPYQMLMPLVAPVANSIQNRPNLDGARKDMRIRNHTRFGVSGSTAPIQLETVISSQDDASNTTSKLQIQIPTLTQTSNPNRILPEHDTLKALNR